jgi:hypothetical protein
LLLIGAATARADRAVECVGVGKRTVLFKTAARSRSGCCCWRYCPTMCWPRSRCVPGDRFGAATAKASAPLNDVVPAPVCVPAVPSRHRRRSRCRCRPCAPVMIRAPIDEASVAEARRRKSSTLRCR